MSAPADLGPQINPKYIEIDREYYWSCPAFPSIYTKGTVVKKVTRSGEVDYYFKIPGKKVNFTLTVDMNVPWKTGYNKFYEIQSSAQKRATINTLRNLSRYGTRGKSKLPWNVVAHEIAPYLGHGGRRRSRRRK